MCGSAEQQAAALQKISDLAASGFARWYWLGDKGERYEYCSDANAQVEKAFKQANGKGSVNFSLNGHKYIVDFDRLKQVNKSSKKERCVVRSVTKLDGSGTDAVEFVEHILRELETAKSDLECLKVKMLEEDAQLERASRSWAHKEAPLLCELTAMWQRRTPGKFLDHQVADFELVRRVLMNASHEKSRAFFENIKILEAKFTHNAHLWAQYEKCKKDMQKSHRELGITAGCQELKAFNKMDGLIPHLHLDRGINECVLAHMSEKVPLICRDGFDVRRTTGSHGAPYGDGMYFLGELSQFNQCSSQSAERHMIISLVALGDPAFLSGERNGPLPDRRDVDDQDKGHYDCHVVAPGAFQSARLQDQWEFVIFDGKQAYPAMVIKYTAS